MLSRIEALASFDSLRQAQQAHAALSLPKRNIDRNLYKSPAEIPANPWYPTGILGPLESLIQLGASKYLLKKVNSAIANTNNMVETLMNSHIPEKIKVRLFRQQMGVTYLSKGQRAACELNRLPDSKSMKMSTICRFLWVTTKFGEEEVFKWIEESPHKQRLYSQLVPYALDRPNLYGKLPFDERLLYKTLSHVETEEQADMFIRKHHSNDAELSEMFAYRAAIVLMNKTLSLGKSMKFGQMFTCNFPLTWSSIYKQIVKISKDPMRILHSLPQAGYRSLMILGLVTVELTVQMLEIGIRNGNLKVCETWYSPYFGFAIAEKFREDATLRVDLERMLNMVRYDIRYDSNSDARYESDSVFQRFIAMLAIL